MSLIAKFLGGLVLVLFVIGFILLLPAWLLMLVLGMLHANEGWAINFSFWTTWGLLYVVGAIGSAFNGSVVYSKYTTK